MAKSDIPIDRGWAWFTVLGGFVNQMFVVGGARSFGVIFVHMTEHFDASTTSSTLAMALMAFGIALYSPIATLIAKKYTFRMVAMIGAAAQGLSFFSAAFAPNIYAASLLIGIIDGIGVGFIFAPSISAVGRYFVKHRSLAIGIASAGTSAGQLTIPLLVRLLLDTYGFRGCMMIYGAVTWNCLAASALLRPRTFYTKRQRPIVVVADDGETKAVVKVKVQDKVQVSDSFLASGIITENCGHSLVRVSRVRQDSSRSIESGTSSVRRLRKISTNFDVDDGSLRGETIVECENELNALGESDFRVNSTTVSQKDASSDNDDASSSDETDEEQQQKRNKCCDNVVLDTFKDMFDPTIIKRPLFIFYTIGIFCANSAMYNSIAFLPAFAKDAGLTKQQASIILATSGFADIPGRVFSAIFNNFQLFSTRHLMSVAVVVILTTSAVCLTLPSFTSLMVLGVILGCFGGIYFALFPVYLLEFIGPQKFPAALALTLMLNGVANLLLPLVAGAIYDSIGSYTIFSWILIVMEMTAVIMYQLDPLARRMEDKKHKRRIRKPQDPQPTEKPTNSASDIAEQSVDA